MEDQTFIWRSMYSDHLQRWLKVEAPATPPALAHEDHPPGFPAFPPPAAPPSRLCKCPTAQLPDPSCPPSALPSPLHFPQVYPPESILVVPSESLKEPASFRTVMDRFARLLGLPQGGPQVHNELIFKSSPASTDGHVHENGRSYIGVEHQHQPIPKKAVSPPYPRHSSLVLDELAPHFSFSS